MRISPFGDLHKVRGPGTKLQQGQDKARGRKTPVPGICDAQTERRGRVSKDSLGWREGAMDSSGWAEGHGNRAGVEQAQDWCADSLAWCRTHNVDIF